MLSVQVHEQRDPGFTLVELVVAMVLLSIVLVVAGTVIFNGFAGSNKSINERRAIQQAKRTMSSLEATIRATKSPDRDEAIIPDTNTLSSALLSETPPTVQGRRSATGPQVTLDVDDILYADSSRLVVRSDVLPQPGVECVEYLVQTTGSDRKLIRNMWLGSPLGTAPTPCPAGTAPFLQETLISLLGES